MRRASILSIALALSLTYGAIGCGGDSSSDSSNGSGSAEGSGSQSSGGEGGGDGGGGGESGGGESGQSGGSGGNGEAFQLHHSDTAEQAHGAHASQIRSTATQAAMRLFVVNPDTGPIEGIVIKLTAPDGTAFYTGETDSQGYGEVLVPINQRYQIEYLSLGRRAISASVNVPDGPNQDIRLTMRYRQWQPPPRAATPQAAEPAAEPQPQGFVLDGVLFDTGRATIQAESFPRLDRVVEYMTHRVSARIRISGHTDNVGNPRRNQQLSEQRARAVRTYLTEHGIDGARVEAVGFGDQRPVATNETEEGRAQNRRIEAEEM